MKLSHCWRFPNGMLIGYYGGSVRVILSPDSEEGVKSQVAVRVEGEFPIGDSSRHDGAESVVPTPEELKALDACLLSCYEIILGEVGILI